MPTFQGSTIQRAIEAGLKQLGLPRDAVSVQVVQENKNGFLGFMRKPAIVNLKPLEPPADPAPTGYDFCILRYLTKCAGHLLGCYQRLFNGSAIVDSKSI